MMGNVFQDSLEIVKHISPLFILLGGLAFADIVMMTIVNLVKKAKSAVKW